MNKEPAAIGVLPHSVMAEKAVVSVLLQYPEKIDEAPSLTQEHFHLPTTRIVFGLIQELTAAGKSVELVSFIQTLTDRGLLDRAGGPSSVTDVYTYQPSSCHFVNHVAILSEKLARRKSISVGAELQRLAYEEEEPLEIITATAEPISEIHDLLTGNRSATSTKAVLRECFSRWEKLCTGQLDPMGMETSLAEINRRFRGLHGKQTVVISGYPGGGKTALAGQLAIDVAVDGHNSLICSLEMPAESLMSRALAYVARRPGDAITHPLKYCREQFDTSGPTKDLLEAVQSATKKISASPFSIEDLIGANVYKIAACIRRAHRKNPLALVVVDYAQRIRAAPEMRRESREQQLAHASNHLADLAKELGFCLLLPSQLNKEATAKHAEAINEDADLHLQIVQDRTGNPPTYAHKGIAVAKDRHNGEDGQLLSIVLDAPMVRFIAKPLHS